MERHKTVEAYLESLKTFRQEVERLREILNSTPLTEEVKWGAPAYTYAGKIVVGIGAFKEHFALWFHQGALLADEGGHLMNANKGKTQALRQWRMTSKKDIKVRLIKAYVKEAIAHVDEGKSIRPSRGKAVVVPPELQAAFKKDKAAAKAFKELTLGKQRDYAEHVAEAKRAETKARRIEKILPMIKAGGGLHDKYRC
ncbi:MAG: YdeI/OmpD-associated family protein [Planctomycetota bacterium]